MTRSMKVLSWLYKKVKKQAPPYYFNYSIGTIKAKPIRNFLWSVLCLSWQKSRAFTDYCGRWSLYRYEVECVIKEPCKCGGGITIGRNAVVGAATLVNKDIPDGMAAVGIPCRIIEASGYVKDISKERCQHHDELEILQPCDDTQHSSTRGTGFDEHKG